MSSDRTIADFEARAQKIKIFDLHSETAYNASTEDLKGKVQLVSAYKTVWVWFVPAGSYDGTVHFEISPDGGVTWFATEGYDPAARNTMFATIASPDGSDNAFVHVPSHSHIRVRMDGGTQGNLTVHARLVDADYMGV